MTPPQRAGAPGPAVGRALRKAAVAASRAPSVHNTQPWRFVLGATSLDIYAESDRRLRVLDPHGRQLMVSLGCALFNARVSLAGLGFATKVERFPDPTRQDLVATIELDDQPGNGDDAIAVLEPAIELRQTNRRPFTDVELPVELLDAIGVAAFSEDAAARVLSRPEHIAAVVELSRVAAAIETDDPAYRAEVRAWTSDDPGRRDGVPSIPIPELDAGGPAYPGRGPGRCLVVLGSLEDNREAWLRTGEATERVLLEVARYGFTSSPYAQIIEVARTNLRLRQELQLSIHPHVVLRIGRAPASTPTRRRRLVDVIVGTEPP